MSQRNARRLGFWTASALLFGSVVGIGIFVKNGGVLRATNFNGVATLLAWIVGGLISLFAAISFSEIGAQKTTNVHGLAGWAETGIGKRFGYFTRFNYGVFYNAVLVIVISFYVSELFFQIVASQNAGYGNFAGPAVWVHVVVALVVATFFVGLNLTSVFASGLFSTIASVLKFVPLGLAALIGLILATTNNAGGFNNIASSTNPFKFEGLLAALPGVLFAYDAFLNVGVLSNKTKGGTKTVSRATLVTMIAVVVLYTAVSISQNLHNAAWVQNVFFNVFPTSTARGVTIFVWTFILISALGVTNGISASLVAQFQQSVLTNTFFGAKSLRAKYGAKKTTSIMLFAIMALWSVVIFVPVLALQSDNFVDSFSNYPTIFFFVIYAIVIIGYWSKRKKIAAPKINNILFYIAAPLAIIGLIFASAYQLFYSYTIRAFIDPDILSSSGFFAAKDITIIQEFGIFAAAAALFFALPALNWVLTKRFENNNVITDTQALVLEEEITEASEFPTFNEVPVASAEHRVPGAKPRRSRRSR